MQPNGPETYYQHTEYDERQRLIRYQSGYQSFLILCGLLMADGFLHELTPIRWGTPLIRYAMMFSLCILYFTLCCIWKDAYHSKFFCSLPWVLGEILFSIFLTVMLFLYLKQGVTPVVNADHTLGFGALYILLALLYGLIALNQLAKLLVDRARKKREDRQDDGLS